MPTIRYRSRSRKEPPSPELRVYFETGNVTSGLPVYDTSFVKQLPTLWNALCDEVLDDWIDVHPGTRPWAWWKYSAPEPRRILGGKGELAWKVYAYAPSYEFGIPFLVHTDPADPPIVEAEAACLRRCRLLTVDERKNLKAADYEPVALEVEYDEPIDELLRR